MADTVADMVVTTEARGLLRLKLRPRQLPWLTLMLMLTMDTVMAVDTDMVAMYMADTVADMVVTTEARGLLMLMPKPLPPLKPMPMLTTDTVMAVDMVATDMAVTDTAVATDMAAMVATTEERGPLMPKPLPPLMLMPMLTTDMVDTTAADTDTVMAVDMEATDTAADTDTVMAVDMEATDTAVDTTGVEYFILIQIYLYRILDLRVENSTNSLHYTKFIRKCFKLK